MNDPSPTSRLDMLHFARRIALQQVEQIDRWIAAEKQKQQRPTEPDERWIVVDSWAPTQPSVIHRATCLEAQDAKRARTVDGRGKIMKVFDDGATVCGLCNAADSLRKPQ